MDQTIAMSRENTGTRLCLAVNYGGRGELSFAAAPPQDMQDVEEALIWNA